MKKLTAVAAIAGAVAVVYVTRKASQGAEVITGVISETGNAINPVNGGNIVNRGITTIVSDATDGKYSGPGALGAWLFCKFHPDAINCKPAAFKMPSHDELKQKS